MAIFTTYHQNAAFVMKALNSIGLEPKQGSRIEQMYSAFFDPTGKIRSLGGPSNKRFRAAKESVREFNLLGFALDNLQRHFSRDELAKMLQVVLKDSLEPQQDRVNSKGRDRQFELYVLATCLAAEMSPARLDEPDVTCTFEDVKFAIAVKRAKSLREMESRVKKAAKQCHRIGLHGIIAIETTLAFNPDNLDILTPIDNEEFGLSYVNEFQRFASEAHGRLRELAENTPVLGIILHHEVARVPPEGGWKTEGMTYGISVSDGDSLEEKLFVRFVSRYAVALPNQTNFGEVRG